MQSVGKIGVALAFVGLPLMALADFTEEAQRMVAGINDECHDYARVRVDAEWAAIERGGRAGDFSSGFKESLFQKEKGQCILTQQILVLEMLREESTEEEWVSLGGRESLQALREKLIGSFPY